MKYFKPHAPLLPHLLADIAAAHRTAIPGEKSPQTTEAHFEEADRWVSGEEPEHRFGYYCGLDPENFPPAEQLADEEMTLLRKAFEKMMFTWNQGIALPEKLRAAFAYKMTVDTLNMKTTIVNSGQMTFDLQQGIPLIVFLKNTALVWSFGIQQIKNKSKALYFKFDNF